MPVDPGVNPPQLLSTPPRQAGTVVLFGEVLADVFPGRTVLGGAPFNVARHLQAFGLHAVLITRTGNDALREALLAAMTACGMDTRGVQCDPVHPTGQVQVHLEQGGHRFEILPDQAYDYIHAAVARMVVLSEQPEMVYFGTLAQRSPVSRRALTTLLQSVRAPRLLDINLREPWFDVQTVRRSLVRADIVKMNEDELSVLARMLRLAGDGELAWASALIRQFHLERVLVTCGAGGAWQLNADDTEVRAGGRRQPVEVVDTVGAGDGFAAVFILGSLRGWPLALTLGRANDFAAALCGIRGAIPADPQFYQAFLEDWKTEQEVYP